MTSEAMPPQDRIHPSVYIIEELEARGWDRWTLAHAMGGEPALNRLMLDLYFEVGPTDSNLRMGDCCEQLASAFSVSPDFFRNLETQYLAAIAPPVTEGGA